MKLVFLIYSMGAGGAERVATNLANYWSEKGWDITIITIVSDQNKNAYPLHHAIKKVSLNLDTKSTNILTALLNNANRIYKIRKTLGELKPQTAIGFMTTSNILLALASFGIRNMQIIGSEHIHPPMFPLGSRLWEFLRSKCYGHLHCMVCLTNETKEWLIRYTTAQNIKVIPNPIAYPIPATEPTLKPEQFLKSGRKCLLAAGRLSYQKGYDLLIQSFSSIAKELHQWDLVILGEGELRHELESLIDALKIKDRVLLLGRAGNLGEWYECANLFVLSSRFEGFGNVIAEAMAYGLPTISMDCDVGPRDIINNGIDGILVNSKDGQKGLELALSNLMTNNELQNSLSKKAIEARKRFSVAKIASMWENILYEKGKK